MKPSRPCTRHKLFAVFGIISCVGPALSVCAVPLRMLLCYLRRASWVIAAALLAPQPWIAASYLLTYLVLRLTMAWLVGVSRGW